MEFFIPSLFLVLIACVATVAIVPRLTPILLVCVATVALIAAASNHANLFTNEYKNMSWAAPGMAAAPYLMVGLLVVLLIGYVLLLFFSGKGPSPPTRMNNIPPPDTATNALTKNIGNGLVNAGMVNVTPINNVGRIKGLNTALSKGT